MQVNCLGGRVRPHQEDEDLLSSNMQPFCFVLVTSKPKKGTHAQCEKLGKDRRIEEVDKHLKSHDLKQTTDDTRPYTLPIFMLHSCFVPETVSYALAA